jgi:hypothetical protein
MDKDCMTATSNQSRSRPRDKRREGLFRKIEKADHFQSKKVKMKNRNIFTRSNVRKIRI